MSQSARPLAIAQIGTADRGGGAATVAAGLMRAYAAHGHQVWHFVGSRQTPDPDVEILADDDRLLFRWTGYTAVQGTLRGMAGRFPERGFGRASRVLRLLTHPAAFAAWRRGLEDFDFPGTRRLLDRTRTLPDIVHGHNLHGGYFDLRELAAISVRVPTLLTLHDMWLLTGHCAHSRGCERWQAGCGSCPDLGLVPAVRRDATALNWRRKQEVYARSRLHVATPSRWLGEQVRASMLAPHVRSLRVIPNGVDRTVFRPADRASVRRALGLPASAFVVLLTTGSQGSMWKDDATLRATAARLRTTPATGELEFVAVGRESLAGVTGRAASRCVPFQHDPRAMARYYQAADVYLHAANADTFPLAVLEAMACGTTVVATAVGGIPEQIRTVSFEALRSQSADAVGDATGVLVPPKGDAQMAEAVALLRASDALRARLAANAIALVRESFTLERQVEAYLSWYRELLKPADAVGEHG